MFHADKILEAARRGELSLDCREMELRQDCEGRPFLVRGPGSIGQDERGRLTFKLFATEHAEFDQPGRMPGPPDPRPGELYQPHHFYTLTAVDSWGNRWTAGRILPKPRDSAPPTAVFAGEFFEMEACREVGREAKNHNLELAIYQEVEIRFNRATYQESGDYESGEKRDPEMRQLSLNKAVFEAGDREFTARKESGALLISVHSPGPIPEHYETRNIEGLVFALGRALSWNESRRRHGTAERIRLRSRRPGEAPHSRPPISPWQDMRFQQTWTLFDRYLRYIGEAGGPDLHPCSSYLFAMHQADAIGIESFALVLAVTIEGLVKALYKHLGKKTDRFEEAVEAFKDYVLAWPDLEQWSKEKELELNDERLSNLVGNLRQISPPDRMYLGRE